MIDLETVEKLLYSEFPSYCFQCNMTRPIGCASSSASSRGVCTKDSTATALQDIIIDGLLKYASAATIVSDDEAEKFSRLYFTTLTNVGFDHVALAAAAEEAQLMACEIDDSLTPVPTDAPASKFVELGVLRHLKDRGMNVGKIVEMVIYGAKGACAYANHAQRAIPGCATEVIAEMIHILGRIPVVRNEDDAMMLFVELCEQCYKAMEVLDMAHRKTQGSPEFTVVSTVPSEGKCILVTGHDHTDLTNLLRLTEGTGINVYTHGEMRNAHAFPAMKKFPHLKGQFGTSWAFQQKEFDAFPGPVLATSNCIMPPRPSYANRCFATGPVSHKDFTYVKNDDFGPVVAAALAAPGFTAEDVERIREEQEGLEPFLQGGAWEQVAAHADDILRLVREGRITKFYVDGGCDAHGSSRQVFTDIAVGASDSTMILTAGCGAYRLIRKKEGGYGDIEGIPRLIDCGGCQDSFSAIKIAVLLAEALECSVNDLPLTLFVELMEQKSYCVLFALLHLGVCNIRIGPSIPKFMEGYVMDRLSDQFGLRQIGTATEELSR